MFSSLTPTGSAPNSAGILAAVAQCAPSTSGGLLGPPTQNVSLSPINSPRNKEQQHQGALEKRSPGESDVIAPTASQGHLLSTLHSAASAPSGAVDPASWDPRDIKPTVSKHVSYFK
ncbi:unnamed protein product [Strongylus vulgaris]|uniref:Uncharacterized protein n=1 Tax=Strongylus vulgaris TaxID=40348 RepID=A0A3P7KZP3_STRVU|nr:unnamed protein product [Strongylus vulgaris]